MIVFSNTTPFIALSACDQLDLMPTMFGVIYVVEGVSLFVCSRHIGDSSQGTSRRADSIVCKCCQENAETGSEVSSRISPAIGASHRRMNCWQQNTTSSLVNPVTPRLWPFLCVTLRPLR